MSDRIHFSLQRRAGAIIAACAQLVVISLFFAACSGANSKNEEKTEVEAKTETKGEHGQGATDEVKLSTAALKAAKIETAEVTRQSPGEILRVTGSVETNQQQTQQVTPLVSGRVERVNVALGDRVRAGAALAVVSSPQVAELHGKLHEAGTRLTLPEKNLARVQKPENRVAVLQAKARLDEAEINLRRTQRLTELGAGAGKDLTAAETAYRAAKAEYEFQSNISLSREVQQAQADVETASGEVSHLRNSLRSLGADLPEGPRASDPHDISLVVLRAPVSGVVTERLVNAGAGIEAGKPLFTISNISNLWVIANVPEAQVRRLRVGAPAQVRAADGEEEITGRVTYIDPILSEETRTARVRVETSNPGGRFKVGSFVQVSFRTRFTGDAAGETALAIPEEAVQRIGERTVVFVPKEKEVGHFEVREIELGGVADGMRHVTDGLRAGERVVTQGGFTLKTQLMKGELREAH